MDELQTEGISTQKIQEFQEMLQERNLTVDGAKSIYQYSVGSNMILGVKKRSNERCNQRPNYARFRELITNKGCATDRY